MTIRMTIYIQVGRFVELVDLEGLEEKNIGEIEEEWNIKIS
jgi:hypothetical protein